MSEALNNQVRLVNTEKKEMIDEAKTIITTIRQMESSLDDTKQRRDYNDDEEFKITYPLNRCLQNLKEKQIHISRLHKERFEQVKSMYTCELWRDYWTCGLTIWQNLFRH